MMKAQKIKKQLTLKKITVSHLNRVEAREIKGRGLCMSWWDKVGGPDNSLYHGSI
ncbi:MAG: hypothetical protein GY765_28850 [bacterium]|nr:hypothetical protein [bacterium]